jgi:exodeoxyribonuclease V alpha subunit
MRFMAEAGISSRSVGLVWKTFGAGVEEILLTDPWSLVRVRGITFPQADEVASRLGVDMSSNRRLCGALTSAIQDCSQGGHLFATSFEVVQRVGALISEAKDNAGLILEAIALMREEGSIVVESREEGGFALYDPALYAMESESAVLLAGRRLAEAPVLGKILDGFAQFGPAAQKERECIGEVSEKALRQVAAGALRDWSAGSKIVLTEHQAEAALYALTAPVSVLTGLPGTGKTTTLRAVVDVLRDTHIPFLLCAPTGIAAKRLALVAGATASTIHRAFGAKDVQVAENREATYLGIVGESSGRDLDKDATKQRWGYGPGNTHPAKVVICDESSMLDQHLLYRILSGTDPDCRLVFVGDSAQLPSVGAGDVLREIVKSEVFPVSHLDTIFRQEDTSGIILAAHAVHRGEVPQSDGKDFVLISTLSDEEAADYAVSLAEKLYQRRANFQVLSPRHAGAVGVTALNDRIRSALNPGVAGLAEVRLGGEVIREDDRVMVIRNDYELDVYNGDVGKVARIDRKAREIEVKIHGVPGTPPRHVRFAFKDAVSRLRLAYAQTVHKSQGQEYDVIVMPVVPSFGRQLQRNLFYTAITRAREKVVLVGKASAIASAVHNDRADQRNTMFAVRIREAITSQ